MLRVERFVVTLLTTFAVTTAAAREMPLPRWDWVLSGEVDAAALVERRLDYVGLDAFDAPAETVAALRDAGTHVWCYLSAGTVEDWRPDLADYEAVPGLIGEDYGDWPGERWLDIRALDDLMPLIEARLALCAEKGFDMVEFDNIDGYGHPTGFDLDAADQVAFIRSLADAAGRAGLAPILKNAPEFAPELEPLFAAYLMEGCVLWDFCDSAAPFSAAGKPAFNVEYPDDWMLEHRDLDLEIVCDDARHGDVAMLVKTLDLTMETTPCP
jgi:hypothetical protein